jgi:hypothetical protein
MKSRAASPQLLQACDQRERSSCLAGVGLLLVLADHALTHRMAVGFPRSSRPMRRVTAVRLLDEEVIPSWRQIDRAAGGPDLGRDPHRR